MVMSQMPEPKMVMKLNPSGVVVYTKIEPEKKMVKLSPSQELAPVIWFNKAKHGSVIPAKRRSVKRMMFDQFVQSIAHLFCSHNKANSPFNMTIYPL